jgi:hypothetical protein
LIKISGQSVEKQKSYALLNDRLETFDSYCISTLSLFFARNSFSGSRSPELRSLALVKICNVELRSIEFDRSSNLRNGASAFYFMFRKIFLLISDRFLSCLGIEPRMFGFKVKPGGFTKQPTNFREKILN